MTSMKYEVPEEAPPAQVADPVRLHDRFLAIEQHLASLADGQRAQAEVLNRIQEDVVRLRASDVSLGYSPPRNHHDQERPEMSTPPAFQPEKSVTPLGWKDCEGELGVAVTPEFQRLAPKESEGTSSRELMGTLARKRPMKLTRLDDISTDVAETPQQFRSATSVRGPTNFRRMFSPSTSSNSLSFGPQLSPHAMPKATRDELKKRKSTKGLGQLQTSTVAAYKKQGCAASCVLSHKFEALSIGIIAFNALWIAVDTDLNKADLLLNADPQYIVAENAFCAYFVIEWVIRFNAFNKLKHAFSDPWFIFDTFLVGLMILEIWVMTAVVWATQGGNTANLGSASILKVLRLLRLTRLTRMVRLLRSLPELLFMLRGVVAATRSVGCTLGMLLAAVYVFGIAFAQLAEGEDFGARFFPTVPDSMYTLLLNGALLDSPRTVMDAIREESIVCSVLFGVAILITHLTIMNMLIGVLCDVVTKVSAKEKEDMDYCHVKDKLKKILNVGGYQGEPKDLEELVISKEEFVKLVQNDQALDLLEKAGVDPVVLLDFADFFFQSDKLGHKFDRRVTFEEFVELIMKLRNSNTPALRDVSELRKYVRDECLGLKVTLAMIKEGQYRLEAKLEQNRKASEAEAAPQLSGAA